MEKVVDDPKTGKVRHCSECEAIIQDLLYGYKKPDDVDEDVLGELPLLDEHFDDLENDILELDHDYIDSSSD